MMIDEIPLCQSCGHHHILGVKCDICGHVGKSQIFEKMRVKANEKRSIQMNILEGNSFSDRMNSFFVHTILQIRRQMYEEYTITDDPNNEDIIESSSYHLYMTIGDSPCGIARWKYIQDDNNKEWNLIIDRLYILPNYRRKYYSYHCLYTILMDITRNQNISINTNYVGYIDILITTLFKYYTNNIQLDQWLIQKFQNLEFKIIYDQQGNALRLRLHIDNFLIYNNLLLYIKSKFNHE